MDNSFLSLVDQTQSVLILLPNHPNFDQVAAALAIYLSLRNSKSAVVSCPEPMRVEFNRLVGVDKITSEVGNKNLMIRFVNYPAENIERVSADEDQGEFVLTVTPKTGLVSPATEQIKMNFSGVSAGLVILIGGENEGSFAALTAKDLGGAKLIHFGTKVLGTNEKGSVLSFARPASSVSEVVAEIIKDAGLVMEADIATNLIAGIETGSNRLSGAGVSANTFELLAFLLRSGGQRTRKEEARSVSPTNPILNPDLQANRPEKTEKKEMPREPAPKDWFEPKIYKGTSIN
jgi:hypothetical protein